MKIFDFNINLISKRQACLESVLADSCYAVFQKTSKDFSRQIQANIKLIDEVRLHFLFEKILNVVTCVAKFFNRNFSRYDTLLSYNALSKALQTKHVELLHFSTATSSSDLLLNYKDHKFPPYLHLGVIRLQRFQYDLYNQELHRLQKHCKKSKKLGAGDHRKMWDSLPKLLQVQIQEKACQRGLDINQVKEDLSILTCRGADKQPSLLHELRGFYSGKLGLFDSLVQEKQKEVITFPLLDSQGKAVDPTKYPHVFEATLSGLQKNLKNTSFINHPISVLMASVEYQGFVKEGGLAEAVEGLSKGLKEQHPGNKVTLVFPKFSHLPYGVQEKLQLVGEFKTRGEESYKVYSYVKDGVECRFIDHPSFDLQGHNSVYGPDEQSQNERFAAFNKLGADYIKHHLESKPDVVHLHDWHVAGIGLELKKEEEKKKEKEPTVVFTFHNNCRMAQGRVSGGNGGMYNCQGLASAYVKWGIIADSTNLFAEMINKADFVTTVSETFAEESQNIAGDSQGVATIIRNAARIGKFVGILNGANPHSFNPQTDEMLKTWKDVDSGKEVDLTYGPTSPEDILVKKRMVKDHLQKWLKKYYPEADFDCNKPFVTFIGRFDSGQKGLDMLEEAINATIKGGGQFICMGSGDPPGTPLDKQQDREASRILDRLQKKYTKGVLWVRDYKEKQEIVDPKTQEKKQVMKFHYQQGSSERPGIGSLIRAASEYVLVPSSFEPCGLVQFEGWLFGSLAIGSKVGGLADSIIPPSESSEECNGFLFHRNSSEGPGCAEIIQKALDFWKTKDDNAKTAIMKKVMQSGRRSGWGVRPRKNGSSPAEKYRWVYHAASQRSHENNPKKLNSSVDEVYKRLKHQRPKYVSSYAKLEEIYLTNYLRAQQTGITSEELEKLYLQFPEEVRHQFPPPYGVNVHSTKYVEYGSLYTSDQTSFKVYAPNAKTVELVLFDDQDNVIQTRDMSKNQETGDWAVAVSQLPLGQRYQYRINNILKTDPYARQYSASKTKQGMPYSIVANSAHTWTDSSWMASRHDALKSEKGMSIYEVHPTTWKKNNGNYLNYKELAHQLVEHAQKQGFTHVELMGLLEHPDERSGGYQVTGFFAPNSRLGSVDDFKYLVDYLHAHKIGVILDFVPGHFAVDSYGLGKFDGSDLFEPKDTWINRLNGRYLFQNFGAKHFDFSKKSVREFLISSANFWLQEMHLDGLRVDCVAGMLYSENPIASKLFLQDLNATVRRQNQGVVTIAEDYSGYNKVLNRFSQEGLGFDFKWNTGLTVVVNSYFTKPSKSRKARYESVKKELLASTGGQIANISHDDLNKNSPLLKVLSSMPQDERIATWKSILSLLMTSQGHKLVFSGAEFSNNSSWEELIGSSGDIMSQTQNQQVLALMKALNQLQIQDPLLRNLKGEAVTEWIEDPNKQVHAYRLRSKTGSRVILHNFTNEGVSNFAVNLRRAEKTKVSADEKKAELKKNLDRIEHKVWFVALRLLIDKVLSVIPLRERQWVRLYIEESGKQKPLLLKVQKVSEATMVTTAQILKYSQDELFHLLSTPVELHQVNPKEMFNSDAQEFGGGGALNAQITIAKEQLEGVIYNVRVPASSSIVIEEYNHASK